MISETVSHYRILKKLGAGGMGEVYSAQDMNLDRIVALKILPEDMASNRKSMSRFLQEAKASSALSHPNLCIIYEVGETDDARPFIAMEYVEGQTLDSQIGCRALEAREIIDFGIQIADAVNEAHSKGIVHRDLKPGNIMVTPRGQVKVLDFGLAKVLVADEPERGTEFDTQAKTDPGTMMGTVQYMSPEQALGRKADHRTDIFSLGTVLYEMATGRRPFTGATTTETIDRILHAQPEAIARLNYDVPASLEQIIRKCMEKAPDRRYQSVRELLVDLRNLKRDTDSPGIASDAVTGGVASRANAPLVRSTVRHWALIGMTVVFLIVMGIRLFRQMGNSDPLDSIAILPFVNASADPSLEYFSDGVTESIINTVSQLPNLKVIARTSVLRYKGREVDPTVLGKELGVRAILVGRILQRGENFWIGVELVDASGNRQIWGGQYNRRIRDIFAVQEEISREISEKLRLRLTGEEKKRLTKRYTDNTEAYQLYLKGRYLWNKRTEADLRKSVEQFQQAVDLDRNFALPYAGLADCYALLGMSGDDAFSPLEAALKAKGAAIKALEIDNDLAEVHASLGLVAMVYDWDWLTAEKEFKRAIELNPNYPTAHQWYANYLTMMERFDEANAEGARAQDLDPVSPIITAAVARNWYYARQYDKTIEECRKTLELDPNFYQAHSFLGMAYLQKAMFKEAIAEFKESVTLTRGSATEIAILGHTYAVIGQRTEAIKLLNDLNQPSERRKIPAMDKAILYADLGDRDRAFQWLSKACEERSVWLLFLKVEPLLDNLRSDPRFADLVRRTGLRL